MIPTKILEAIITKLTGDAAGKFLARSTDEKGKFARMLLTYHRSMEEYSKLTKELLELLHREHELIPSGRVSSGTARRIGQIAERMTDAVGKMVRIFQHEWSTSVNERFRSEGASRRTEILTIFSPEFALLLEATTVGEVVISTAAESLSRDWLDWDEQKMYIFDPTLSEIPPNVQISELACHSKMHRRALDLRNTVDHAFLIGALRDVISRIDQCLTQLRQFMSKHFTVADML
jgi:hypothetical protein